jgi:hypothetical protein
VEKAVPLEPRNPFARRTLNQKHTLSHYRGGSTVSALEAACVYDAGVKLLLPGQDPGLDLGREHALAQGIVTLTPESQG